MAPEIKRQWLKSLYLQDFKLIIVSAICNSKYSESDVEHSRARTTFTLLSVVAHPMLAAEGFCMESRDMLSLPVYAGTPT
jgi:hypothetical protein